MGLTFAVYLSSPNKLTSLDTWPTILSAKSLIQEGNIELSETLKDPSRACVFPQREYYYLRCTPKGIFSAYPIGLVTIAFLILKLRLAIGIEGMNDSILRKVNWWGGIAIAVATVLAFFGALSTLVNTQTAFMWSLCLAFGSALFTTSAQGLWSQGGTTLGIAAYLYWRLSSHPQKTTGYAGGLLLGVAVACRTSAFLWAFFLLGELFHHSKRKGLQASLVLLGISLIVHGIYYWLYENLLGPQWIMAKRFGLGKEPLLAGLALWISPSRGLLIYQPWLIALGLFLFPDKRKDFLTFLRERKLTGLLLVLFVATMAHLIMIACWPMWWGGFSWGSRLQMEVLPGLAIAAAILAWISFPSTTIYTWTLLILFSSLPHLKGIYSKDPSSWMSSGSKLQSQLWAWSGGALFPRRK